MRTIKTGVLARGGVVHAAAKDHSTLSSTGAAYQLYRPMCQKLNRASVTCLLGTPGPVTCKKCLAKLGPVQPGDGEMVYEPCRGEDAQQSPTTPEGPAMKTVTAHKGIKPAATPAKLHEAVEADTNPANDQWTHGAGAAKAPADPTPPPAAATAAAPAGDTTSAATTARAASTRTAGTSGPLAGLRFNQGAGRQGAPHLMVVARAGTGKTTTLVAGLQVLKGMTPTDARGNTITPSPQQRAVWDALLAGRAEAHSACFVAFNKSIATELQSRVPAGCQAMTMHSLGVRAVNKAFGRLEVAEFKVQGVVAELTGRTCPELFKNDPVLLTATARLVSLCKLNLINVEDTEDTAELAYTHGMLDELAKHYEVSLQDDEREDEDGAPLDYRARVYDLVPRVLARCRNPMASGTIDYDDMIWLPVILDLPVFRFDLLLIDEAQDLSRVHHALARKTGRRLVLCGDPRQAIYGFAGADCESMPRLASELAATPRGCTTLPLTVTRRCGKAIVEEARRQVPDFEAHENNGPGLVGRLRYDELGGGGDWYQTRVQDGDMIICRVNAPLVSQCFRFIRQGRKAYIQGRDVGKGLTSLVERLKAADVFDLSVKLDAWRAAEVAKERAKAIPSEARIIAMEDRAACVAALSEGANLVSDVTARIQQIFSDQGGHGIRLSSVHRAKGLEANRVFFLMPKGAGCPHPMATSPWQREQELNCLYIGITRAIKELYYVR